MASLELISGLHELDGGCIRIPPSGSCTIGRLKGNDVVLSGEKVSREHAVLNAQAGRITVTDSRSTYGTHVNGQKIVQPTALKKGDELAVGEWRFRFVDGVDDAGQSSSRDSEPHGITVERLGLDVLYRDEVMVLKRRVHEIVLSKLKLTELSFKQKAEPDLQAKVNAALDAALRDVRHELPVDLTNDALRGAMWDELMEFGPISPLLRDESLNEIMVNGPALVFVERKGGKISETGIRFFDDRHLMSVILRIVEPLGRRIDESSPMVDARLPDGSRVNAIIPPLALDGPSLTIRKFSKEKLTTTDLIAFGSMTTEMSAFLQEAVRSRQNIIISGGTGSGKTTLLNVLSQFIDLRERVVTVEDSAELKLSHRDLVRLEARPPNVEGKGRVSIRDLVVNTLRMRPDRIIVGECRGAEAFDMLQAMNTGHDGSLTTVHANTPRDAVLRLENMVLMAGFELPSVAIREQIAAAIDLIVQQTRLMDGSRKITQISEVTGREGNVVLMQDIFLFEQTGFSEGGKVVGEIRATGNMPRFVEVLRQKGDLRLNIDVFKRA